MTLDDNNMENKLIIEKKLYKIVTILILLTIAIFFNLLIFILF
jgi:hypothetical protein